MKWFVFTLRFACIAPICLAAWWYVLPAYAKTLGFFSVLILRLVFFTKVESFQVITSGILHTSTVLQLFEGERVFPFPIAQLATNMAPFVALTLATNEVLLWKRVSVLCPGCLMLAASHLLYILLAFLFGQTIQNHPYIPHIVAYVFLTLPFLLWIVFLHLDKIPKKSA